MSSHRLDPLSLFGGVVFLSFGAVGVLHSGGWVDSNAPLWVAVIAAAGLGLAGIGLSLRAALIEGSAPPVEVADALDEEPDITADPTLILENGP